MDVHETMIVKWLATGIILALIGIVMVGLLAEDMFCLGGFILIMVGGLLIIAGIVKTEGKI